MQYITKYGEVPKHLKTHYDHAIEQAIRRYGIKINYDELEYLNSLLFYEDESVEFMFQHDSITSVYATLFMNKGVALYFSETIFCITTFLPGDDMRLSGLTPDGGKPAGNFDSPERQRRLWLARKSVSR